MTDIQPYWFSRTESEIRAAVDGRPETWASVPGWSGYEWSDKGRARSLDRTVGTRQYRGTILKLNAGSNGYLSHTARNDRGERCKPDVAPMVLLAHHPAFRGLARFPDGLETRHNPVMGSLFNAYPEGLWPGTRVQNEREKDAPPPPQHPCRNVEVCGNMVHHPGKRCVPCTEAVGREAAQLLGRGANLMAVAEHFGYTGPDWVYGLAVKYGRYEGSKSAALAQNPGMMQRVRLRAAMTRPAR